MKAYKTPFVGMLVPVGKCKVSSRIELSLTFINLPLMLINCMNVFQRSWHEYQSLYSLKCIISRVAHCEENPIYVFLFWEFMCL
jgi:hypothetical protein